MTKEEAIERLNIHKSTSVFVDSIAEAIDMAIEALSAEEKPTKAKEDFRIDDDYKKSQTIPTFTESAEAYKAWTGEEMGGGRLIDADALLDKLPKEYLGSTVHLLINNAQTVSAEAVQGEWEHWGSPFSDESEVIDTIVCSVCGARFIEPKDEPKGEYNYCPNCGAKMGGDGE